MAANRNDDTPIPVSTGRQGLLTEGWLEICSVLVSRFSVRVVWRFSTIQLTFHSFVVNDQRYENILNLFGCVDAKYTSHEVQGLKIVIRLMKTLAAEHWPRLEKWPGRNQFIKCVAECDDSDSDENGNVSTARMNRSTADFDFPFVVADPDERKFLPLADGTDSSFSDDDEYNEDNEDILNSMEI